MPHSFQTLQTLKLRKVLLKNDDLHSLSRLKLVRLDLASTGVSTEATAHLVPLKKTLEDLDLSNNPKIKHWACYNVSQAVVVKHSSIFCLIRTATAAGLPREFEKLEPRRNADEDGKLTLSRGGLVDTEVS